MSTEMTFEDLKKYDGTGPDNRILVAIKGNIYDVSKARNFYGPGGSYAAFAGRDASRGLATFKVSVSDNEYDDLSDLTPKEIESLTKWETKFKEKYNLVGKLVKLNPDT
nr:membrane-associated progesterone receptor component 1-like [Onthophagus taurus]